MSVGNKIGDIIPYIWNGRLKKGRITFFKHGVPNVEDTKVIDKLKHK